MAHRRPPSDTFPTARASVCRAQPWPIAVLPPAPSTFLHASVCRVWPWPTAVHPPPRHRPPASGHRSRHRSSEAPTRSSRPATTPAAAPTSTSGPVTAPAALPTGTSEPTSVPTSTSNRPPRPWLSNQPGLTLRLRRWKLLHNEEGCLDIAGMIKSVQCGLVIVADDKSRENEGDLIMAVSLFTLEAVTFIVRHGTGIICVSMKDDMERLILALMVTAKENEEDAKEGTTTGVSAKDRVKIVITLLLILRLRTSTHNIRPLFYFLYLLYTWSNHITTVLVLNCNLWLLNLFYLLLEIKL